MLKLFSLELFVFRNDLLQSTSSPATTAHASISETNGTVPDNDKTSETPPASSATTASVDINRIINNLEELVASSSIFNIRPAVFVKLFNESINHI